MGRHVQQRGAGRPRARGRAARVAHATGCVLGGRVGGGGGVEWGGARQGRRGTAGLAAPGGGGEDMWAAKAGLAGRGGVGRLCGDSPPPPVHTPSQGLRKAAPFRPRCATPVPPPARTGSTRAHTTRPGARRAGGWAAPTPPPPPPPHPPCLTCTRRPAPQSAAAAGSGGSCRGLGAPRRTPSWPPGCAPTLVQSTQWRPAAARRRSGSTAGSATAARRGRHAQTPAAGAAVRGGGKVAGWVGGGVGGWVGCWIVSLREHACSVEAQPSTRTCAQPIPGACRH